MVKLFQGKIEHVFDIAIKFYDAQIRIKGVDEKNKKDKDNPFIRKKKQLKKLTETINIKLKKQYKLNSIISMIITLLTESVDQDIKQGWNLDKEIGLPFPNGVLYHYADTTKFPTFHTPPINSNTTNEAIMGIGYQLRKIHIIYIYMYNILTNNIINIDHLIIKNKFDIEKE